MSRRPRKTSKRPRGICGGGAMWAKSAIRRHVKQFPLTAEMSAAVAIEDAADTGMLDITQMGDPETVQAVIAGETEPPIEDVEFEETPPLEAVEDEGETEPAKKTTRPRAARKKKEAVVDPKPEPETEAAEEGGKAPPLAETVNQDPRPEPPAEVEDERGDRIRGAGRRGQRQPVCGLREDDMMKDLTCHKKALLKALIGCGFVVGFLTFIFGIVAAGLVVESWTGRVEYGFAAGFFVFLLGFAALIYAIVYSDCVSSSR